MSARPVSGVRWRQKGGPARGDGIKVPKTEDRRDFPEPSRQTLMKPTPVGIDIQLVAGFTRAQAGCE